MDFDLVMVGFLYGFIFVMEIVNAWHLRSIRSLTNKYVLCFYLSGCLIAAANLTFQGAVLTDVTKSIAVGVIIGIPATFFFYTYLFFRGVQVCVAFLQTFVKGKTSYLSHLSATMETFQRHTILVYALIVTCTVMQHIGPIIGAISLLRY